MTAISLKKFLPFLEWLPFMVGLMRTDRIVGNIRIEVVGDKHLFTRIVATLKSQYNFDNGLLMFTSPINLRT